MTTDLDKFNELRKVMGRRQITNYYCETCGKLNDHLTSACKANICKLCFGQHLTSNCEYLASCQWCNGNHPSRFCSSHKQDIANSWRRCLLCGRIGHIAKDCTTRIRKRFRPRFRRRRHRPRRRRRYRYRY